MFYDKQNSARRLSYQHNLRPRCDTTERVTYASAHTGFYTYPIPFEPTDNFFA